MKILDKWEQESEEEWFSEANTAKHLVIGKGFFKLDL